MNTFLKRTTVAAILAGLLAAVAIQPAFAGGGNAGNKNIAPIQSHPYGKSYAEWGAAWWQWALSLPVDQNPWFDATGDMIANGQSGDVWFLTGFVLATELPNGGWLAQGTRTVTVPAGKALFFPVVNSECSTLEVGTPWYGPDEASLRACVVGPVGPILFAEIDAVPVQKLTDYYALTPIFPFTVPENNVLSYMGEDGVWYPVPGPATGMSMGQGVWLMVKPLPAGQHTIHFGGGDPLGFYLDMTYYITIE